MQIVRDETASAVESAAALRRALKQAFPATRFAVRLGRGTGCLSVHITWTDGPSGKAVDEVAGWFQGATFDGMTDSTNYTGAILPDGRRSGLHFVLTQRHLSAALVTRLIEAVGTFYTVPRSEWPTAEDYRQGRCWNRTFGYRNWAELIGLAAEDRTTVTRV